MIQPKLLFVIFYVLATSLLVATPQAENPGTGVTHVQTDTVECDHPPLRSQSAVSVSPTGNRVLAEVETRLEPGNKQGESHCHTRWLLHVAPRRANFETITVGERDNGAEYQNSFEIIVWSQDGGRLLAAQVVAGGDWDETTPVVYDFASKQVWSVKLIDVFKQIAAADCLLSFRPNGFASDGRVRIEVGLMDASDLAPGEKPCFAKSMWLLDYKTKKVSREKVE